MTKADLIEAVHEKVPGFSRRDAAQVVEMVFELIKDTLQQSEKIKISGFGNFTVNEKHPRKGRNPQTGDEITITARRVLTFKPSQVLKAILNPGHESYAAAASGQKGSYEDVSTPTSIGEEPSV